MKFKIIFFLSLFIYSINFGLAQNKPEVKIDTLSNDTVLKTTYFDINCYLEEYFIDTVLVKSVDFYKVHAFHP